MLTKTKAVAQAVIDKVRPASAPDCQTAYDERGRRLVAGEAELSAMEGSELSGLYDRGAAPQEVEACLARIADKRVEVDHIRRARDAAGRRLKEAQDRENKQAKAGALARCDAVLSIRAKAAARFDALAAEMAEQARLFDAQLPVLNECARDGAASNIGMRITAQTLITFALEAVGAIPCTQFDRTKMQTATDLNERDAGAVRSIRAIQ